MRLFPAALLGATVLATTADAGAARIHVRGKASIQARVVSTDDTTLLGTNPIEVRGVLTDDADSPIDAATVFVSFRTAGAPAPLPRGAQACDPSPQKHDGRGPDDVGVGTSIEGAFCLKFPSAPAQSQIQIFFEGNDDYEPTQVEIPVDRASHTLRLEFSPRLSQISLDRDQQEVGVETKVEGPGRSFRPTVQLQLLDERDRELGQTRVRAGERAQFLFKSKELAGPGKGRLQVRFSGGRGISPASRSVVVERTVAVRLQPAGEAEPGDPADGVPIPVAVGSSHGAVPTGSVQAEVAGHLVGTAPVENGAARLTVRFDAPQGGPIPVRVRYLPDAPWWVPGAPLELTIQATGPSPWRRAPWVAAALLVAFWVIRSWPRPARADRPAPKSERRATGRAAVELVHAAAEGSGWTGEVLDAHEGTPIANARVELRVPAFEGDGVAASTRTDAEGRFEFEPIERGEGARIVTSARWHAILERPLPASGHLTISLVARRRALLDGLVQWAAGRGRPWTQRGEATPGHVARTAEQRAQPGVREWARAVEHAAYGPDAVDEGVEAQVRDLEPPQPGGR